MLSPPTHDPLEARPRAAPSLQFIVHNLIETENNVSTREMTNTGLNAYKMLGITFRT